MKRIFLWLLDNLITVASWALVIAIVFALAWGLSQGIKSVGRKTITSEEHIIDGFHYRVFFYEKHAGIAVVNVTLDSLEAERRRADILLRDLQIYPLAIARTPPEAPRPAPVRRKHAR